MWNRAKSVILKFPLFWLKKPQKIVYSINIYNLPCKLGLCATWNGTKSILFSIFLSFPLLFGALFMFNKLQNMVYSINIRILLCKVDLFET